MRIELELEVVENGGGPSHHFVRAHTQWTFLPRVGDRVEIIPTFLACPPVERVTFTSRSIVRVQLETWHDDHNDLLGHLRAGAGKWRAA